MAKISFNNKENQFFQSIKTSVNNYFTENNLKPTGNWKLFHKAAILIPLSIAIYLFLLTGNYNIITGIFLCIILGLTMVSIAFNVMHDACHGSFSDKKWINNIMGLSMNALGSNAYMWKIKHNVVHHTYTNVDGIDDDIAKSPLLRQCGSQKWIPAHKYQFIYMFLLYMISTILWVFLTDLIKYFSKRIVVTEMKMPVKEHVIFWGTKILYVLFYFAIPAVFVGVLPWLVGYLIVNITMGLVLSIVFQLAHVVEKTEFIEAGDEEIKVNDAWAVHQVKTTCNFATKNPVVSWYTGGLNFQIEHHLFPRVSHIHYPAISEIVKKNCEMFGYSYHNYETMSSAVLSHIKTMKLLGQKNHKFVKASVQNNY